MIFSYDKCCVCPRDIEVYLSAVFLCLAAALPHHIIKIIIIKFSLYISCYNSALDHRSRITEPRLDNYKSTNFPSASTPNKPISDFDDHRAFKNFHIVKPIETLLINYYYYYLLRP